MSRAVKESKINSGNAKKSNMQECKNVNTQTRMIDDVDKDIIKKRPTVRFTKSNKPKVQNTTNKDKVTKTLKYMLTDSESDDCSDDAKHTLSIKIDNMGVQINKDIYEQKEIKILSDEDDDIERIYHISDIHIQREDMRHDEYKQVFNKLYENISQKTEKSLIVITGDVTHDKSLLTTLQLDVVKEFFVKLTDLCTVILIIGNHDINPNQHIKYGDEINSLSSILRYMKTKNDIHLLLEDRCYQYNNIIFGVTTMFTNKVTKVNRQENKIYIGLYHGIINGSSLDNDFIMNTSRFNVTDFSDYDICMFGDIHKFGYLNSIKTMAYAGSLIQQNIGEDLLSHGMIVWNLVNRTSKFVRIKNDYGFVKVEIDNEMIIIRDEKEIPRYPTFYIYHKNAKINIVDKYVNELKEKHKNCKCILYNVQIDGKTEIKFGKNQASKVLSELQSDGSVYKMIMSYIFKKDSYKKLAPKKKKSFKLLFEKTIQDVEYNYNVQVRNIKLKSLKFDNFYLYGKNNKLDFESSKFTNIVGIIGSSYSGKSTIIDVILYSIFGQCSRGNKYNTINVLKREMRTEIILYVNDDEYKISRIRVRKNNNKNTEESAEKVELIKNNVIITSDTVDQTNKNIVEIVGYYNDFLNISTILQKDMKSFIDMTELDRRKTITRLLKIDIFEDIHKSIKNIIRTLEKDIYETKNKNRELNNYNMKYNNIIKELKECETIGSRVFSQYDDFKSMIDDIDKIILTNQIKMEQYMLNENNIQEYRDSIRNITICNKKIYEKQNILNISLQEYNILCAQCLRLEDKIFQSEVSEKKHNEFLKNKNQRIDNLVIEREKLLSSKKIGNEIDFDINIIKKELLTNEEKINEYHDNKNKLINKINDYELINIDKEDEIIKKYKLYIDYVNDEKYIKNEIEKLRIEHMMVTKKIKKLLNHNFDPKCKFCISYPLTVDKISYEADIKKINIDIKYNEEKLSNIVNQVLVTEKNRKKYDQYIKNKQSNECILKNIEKYRNDIVLIDKDILIMTEKKSSLDTMIKRFNSNRIINEHNGNIDIICDKIKKQISDIKNEYDVEYEENLLLRKEYDNIFNDITKMNEKIDKLENEIYDHEITVRKAEKYQNDYKDRVNEYNMLKNNMNISIKRKSEFIHKYEILQKEKKEIEKKIELLRIQRDIEKHNVNIMNEKCEKYDMLKIIASVFDDGMIDDILKRTIFPIIENHANEIIKNVCDYNIQLKCTFNGIALEKIRNDGKVINIETLSGCEYVILNVAFRLALGRCNNSLKTNFIIIDEAFRFCDDDSIRKIPTIFDYIRENFDWGIVISHDDRVIQMYDNPIKISKNSDMTSKIRI